MNTGPSVLETIIVAWLMAVKNRPITKDLIFHSDRGIQYACSELTRLLKNNPGNNWQMNMV
jgi:hypothetical protein